MPNEGVRSRIGNGNMTILKENWFSWSRGDLLGWRFKNEMKSCSSTGSSYLLEGSRVEACPVRTVFKTAANHLQTA